MLYKINDLNIDIRNAVHADIDQIMLIEPEAFGKHHWSKQSFINEFASNYSHYFVAELNHTQKQIIGYIGYWIIQDEGHITTLAVSSMYKRKHLADILLYTLIRDTIKNSINWLTLEVRATNVAAVNLYKKYGFKQLGIRKYYYQDNNEDALILWTDKINTEYYELILQKNLSLVLSDVHDTDKYQYSIR